METNNKNNGKIPSGFSGWAYETIQERKRKRDIVLGGGSDRDKFDNLNCGLPRQEYLDELEQTRKDHYNHTVKLSDGLQSWLNGSIDRQKNERQEQVQRMREQMFPEKQTELSELDQALHDRGELRNYNVRKNAGRDHVRDLLFPPKETEKRRSQIEENRHPMDILMRKQLKDRENERKSSI